MEGSLEIVIAGNTVNFKDRELTRKILVGSKTNGITVALIYPFQKN
jgi:hypothetical protein